MKKASCGARPPPAGAGRPGGRQSRGSALRHACASAARSRCAGERCFRCEPAPQRRLPQILPAAAIASGAASLGDGRATRSTRRTRSRTCASVRPPKGLRSAGDSPGSSCSSRGNLQPASALQAAATRRVPCLRRYVPAGTWPRGGGDSTPSRIALSSICTASGALLVTASADAMLAVCGGPGRKGGTASAAAAPSPIGGALLARPRCAESSTAHLSSASQRPSIEASAVARTSASATDGCCSAHSARRSARATMAAGGGAGQASLASMARQSA